MIRQLRQRARGSLMATVGYMLSPLSWWNDVYVNVPIAYAFAWGVHLIDKRLFGPSLVLFYWITNLAGLLLLHKGLAVVAAAEDERVKLRSRVRTDIILSVVYSGILALLVYFGVIKLPEDYFR